MTQKVRVQTPTKGAGPSKVRGKAGRKIEDHEVQQVVVSDEAKASVERHSASMGAASAADGNGGIGTVPLVLGGVLLAGGIAAAAGGGGSKNVAPALGAIADVSTSEDTAVSGKAAATDANSGDKLTYSVSSAANGQVTIDAATGAFNYTPKANYNGSDTFTVTVTDAAGLSASQAVKVNVASVNDKPTFAAATQSVSTDEDVAKAVTVAATDVDGDAVTYTAADGANGTVQVSGSTVTYTPKANFNGTDSFVVTASDGKGGTATQTINVTIAAVNDKPAFAAASQAVTTDEDVAKAIPLAATDVDGDAVTYTAADGANGTVQVSGSTVTYTPKANFNGADSFVVTASDGKGGTSTQTVNVTVAPVNDVPVILDGTTKTLTVAEDASGEFVILASDIETSSLAAQVTNPAHGTVTQQANGKLFYTPNANYNGTDSFEVGVSDGTAVTKYTVSVAVTPVNDAPAFAAASQSVATDEDVAKVVALAATDVDGDAVTYTAVNGSHGTVQVSGSSVTYTPNANFNGTDSFVVTASDGKGGTSTQTINVAIAPVADSIDVADDTVATVYTATAGVIDKFTDVSTAKTNAIINGMTAEDQIEVTGASADYAFSSVGNDIVISYNKGGVINAMTLTGLAAAGGIITDEESAERVAGFNFFNALTQPSGNGSGDGVAGANGNLDDDNDANPLTTATITATSGADTFTEDASVANSAKIVGFGAGDTITVSGATTSAYSFSSVGTDLHITYTSSAGVVNEIILADAVSSTTFIQSELDAETALGRDFFKDATSGTPSNSSLDVGDAVTRVSLSGAGGAVTFADNASVGSTVVISNFGIDDVIRATGISDYDAYSTGDYDNDGTADDLSMVYNAGAGVINDIQILNVVSPTDFVFDKNSAIAAVGFNFITFA